jgi:methylase of polypeptide subunit release factors
MSEESITPAKQTVELPYQLFFEAGDSPERIANPLHISVTGNTYPPKIDMPRADWVATAAIPAFQALVERDVVVESFASIGTGAGIDALVAAEILNPNILVVTDIHASVVETAQTTIERNLTKTDIHVFAAAGDLCEPLLSLGQTFNLIYENLPNIPLPETSALLDGLNSSSFTVWSATGTDADTQTYLLELHREFLRETKPLLAPGGRAVSCIGARIPIESILNLSQREGYEPEILVYNWKIQSEADEVVRGYAENQRKGLGPFHFYPVKRLAEIFEGVTPHEAAKNASELECKLTPYAIDAETAMGALEQGEPLGHTVVVVANTLRNVQ